ncbi:MAG: class I SAM-dependent methyltransferase, partial [Acidobacteriota bacterium]
MDKSQSSRLGTYWDGVSQSLPAFLNSPSTLYYLECEKMLLETQFPALRDKKILKTDLWDEAKNSQILFWAADQGAEITGIDISLKIAREAKNLFPRHGQARAKAGFIVSDLRSLAVADKTFDYVYSMGTIEHFAEYAQALQECHRVLKKGGLAVIGVPNKWDPFLRPL